MLRNHKFYPDFNARYLAVLLGFLLIATCVQARTISGSEARQLAVEFFARKGMPCEVTQVQSTARHAPGMSVSTVSPLYVFNADNRVRGGYVIVAGDDRAMPVLGYSDSGAFDPSNVPPAMQEWLDFLACEIETLPTAESSTVSNAPNKAARASVAPMLTSLWDQSAPYNIKLPNTSNGSQAVTGCVATAMAQIMYYHKWPAKPSQTIPAYTTSSQSIYMSALSPVSFAWSSMKDTYMGSETGTAANAVATLMLYCDQALQMDFKNGVSSSSTSKVASALSTYFNYAPSARYYSRENYTTEAWENLIYNELQAKRPVAYGGSNYSGSGHSFVCDGYDGTTGMFHFNWGWSGSSNGYYSLSALKPQFQGIGSSSGTEGYIRWQGISVGLMPDNGSGTAPTAMTITSLTLSTVNYTRASKSQSFTGVTWTSRFSNQTGTTNSFYGTWALYNADGTKFVKYIHDFSVSGTYSGYSDLQHNWGGERTYKFTFDSSIANGTYRLYPISRLQNGTTWTLCNGYAVNYILATVTDYSLSLTAYGIGGNKRYSANNIKFNGNQHVGKPIEIVADLNNSGTTMNDEIYLIVHANGVSKVETMAVAGIAPGGRGDVTFTYVPTTTGNKTLLFSLDEEGVNVFATRGVNVLSMPEASLSFSRTVKNASNGQIKGTTFTVQTTITNQKSTAYDEDIMALLYRVTDKSGNTVYGKTIDGITRAVKISGNGSATQEFSFPGLKVGEKYWVKFLYYSDGQQVSGGSTGAYEIVEGGYKRGDVDGNGLVDVDDVNAIVNIILGLKKASNYVGDANVSGDSAGLIDVDDVNAVVNIILGV